MSAGSERATPAPAPARAPTTATTPPTTPPATTTTTPATDGRRRTAAPSPVKILLVDDRPENLLLLEHVLRGPDRVLLRATSGNEALKLMLGHEFAVVLLDVQMPDMDGYETAQLMRSDPRSSQVPIIFVTAGDRNDERTFRGYDVGAVDFIYKPINTQILQSKVDVFVQLHRRAEEVRALNVALERSRAALVEKVADLEAVNRTLSHDLRAPLRSIQGFAQIVAQDYVGRLDANADSHLQRIVRACQRMQQMLDALFRLLKLGAISDGFGDVECGVVLAGVLEDLRVDIEEAGAVVTCQPGLPVVHGHAGLVQQVFQNLITNALKFRGAEPPRVHIGVERTNAEWRFSVADNGVGIGPDHRQSIFGVFNRLGDASIPGTGVGLSLVKRAVEKQGGRIWVDSELGKGSTFRFTIPA